MVKAAEDISDLYGNYGACASRLHHASPAAGMIFTTRYGIVASDAPDLYQHFGVATYSA